MKSAIFSIALLFSASAFAVTGYLQGEQTNGMLKYCKYSNGVIITVNSFELCPLSIN